MTPRPADSHCENHDITEQFKAVLPHLRGYARSLTRNADAADDLVQDALVRAWASREQFAPGTNFRAWMFTIMRHRFLDECRRNKSPHLAIEDVSGHAALVSGPAQDSSIEFEEMASAYWQLAPNHREILMLVGALGLEYEEAASVIGCAVGTVRSRLSRARNELQNKIEHGAGRLTRPSTLGRPRSRIVAAKEFLRLLNAA
ncbi:MAG TPA: sigma-70 family RNA polymerase sigma factor [Hypericibacter adhaerens]|jgi:RNA polymerase sigma-70 factor (ECF subfamily)|uniref:RNA polymerase sigma factor n=1 Tax=Hypericibacter adhaerens TaxID=2602016 RepID=A0A5J6N0D2_9PROT|nr:sigma-70 family RNA polymerase sigma factor [Hypericibacter adhaerens]QEX23468.1 RNA polymerase sigma factor [Hypericibacter adhaerens]HWA41582.1 sigma-70 family RNA polymerase sigma factor [Hypericibacter adhaerens]